jgi:6-phosphogluconolactonase
MLSHRDWHSQRLRDAFALGLLALILTSCGGGGGSPQSAPSGLTYTSPVVLTVGVLAPTISPIVTGSVTTYSISPALPDGLSMSASTGKITGTPAVQSAAASYVIAAQNAAGSTTFTLSLAVLIPAPTALSYPSPETYPIGTAITPISPTVTGFVTKYAVAPTLPAGLSLNAITGQIAGTPTSATNMANYVITASNSTGSTNFSLAITVPPNGTFVYVTNVADGTVSAFSMNTTSGALSLVPGSPLLAEAGNFSIAVDPKGNFAYQSVTENSSIYASAFNPATGALTPLPVNTYFTGLSPVSIEIDPTGQYVYTANSGSNNVSGFAIGASGTLTEIPGSPFSAGSQPQFVAIDPNGDFVYVTNSGDNTVSAFALNAGTGALVPVVGSPFATGNSPRSIAIDPVGHFLYVANFLSSNISAFSTSVSTGVLTPLPGSPFASAGGSSISIEKSGKYLYLADGFTVDGYTLANGVPTPMPGNPFAAGFRAVALAIDATGSFVYALDNAMSSVTALQIDSGTGVLSTVAGSPFALIAGSNKGTGASGIFVVR